MNSRFTSDGQGKGAMKVVMETESRNGCRDGDGDGGGMKTETEMAMEMQGRCVLP